MPIGSQYGLGVYTADTFYTNGPGNDLSYSLNWPGGNSGMTPNHNSTCSGWVSADTMGTHDLTFTLVTSNLFVMGTNTLTQTVHVVAVTNITASTNHVAVGTNVLAFTAQMTPVAAGEHLYWNLPNGGGTLSTNQGLTTSLVCDTPGEFLVMAICGSSFVTTTIKVYAVAGVTASANVVAAGESITFTATTTPDNCPLPLTWSLSTNTGTTTTNSFSAGYYTNTVTLGNSAAECAVTAVKVAEIKYEAVPNSGNWLAWPAPAYFPKGSSFRVRAIPDPYDPNKQDAEQWPSGKPVWGGAAGGTGPIATATFSATSTNLTDFKRLTATCNNTVTNPAVVYEFNRYYEADYNFTNRNTNLFGVGEVIKLEAKILPVDLNADTVGTWLWTIEDSGYGELVDPTAPKATYHGPDLPVNTIGNLKHKPFAFSGSVTLERAMPIEFIAPVLTFKPVLEAVRPPLVAPSDNVGHANDFVSIAVLVRVKVTPSDVAWSKIELREVGGQASEATDFFLSLVVSPPFDQHHAGGKAAVIRRLNGWRMAGYDLNALGVSKPGAKWDPNNPFSLTVPPYDVGTLLWRNIPWEYQVLRNGGPLQWRWSRHVDQKFTSDLTGGLGVEKGYDRVSRPLAAPTLPGGPVIPENNDPISISTPYTTDD